MLVHYAAFIGLVALCSGSSSRARRSQVQQAIGKVPTSASDLHQQAAHSHGIKREILLAIQKRLKRLPSGTSLVHPALTVTTTAFEVLVGIFFMFAVAAYWIFERDKTIGLVQSLVPRDHRRVTRDTWILIDQKLGAFVRGELDPHRVRRRRALARRSGRSACRTGCWSERSPASSRSSR